MEFFFFSLFIHFVVDFERRGGKDLKEGFTIVVDVNGFVGSVLEVVVCGVVDLEVDVLIGVSVSDDSYDLEVMNVLVMLGFSMAAS